MNTINLRDYRVFWHEKTIVIDMSDFTDINLSPGSCVLVKGNTTRVFVWIADEFDNDLLYRVWKSGEFRLEAYND